jgi:hypothetical protein
MPMAAIGRSINPRKVYSFAIEINGLETAYAQKVKIPKMEVKTAKHGDGPFEISTASKVVFGDLEIETLKPANSSSVWWKDWFALVVNLDTGAMGDPAIYKKTFFVVEYAPDGVTIVDRTEIRGAFPVDIDLSDLDKLGEGNAVDKLKFRVDRIVVQMS